ncbi:MAG: hypothetical protein LIP28_00680, partial [Deltaproteobacteria bacterium]|nr:hypothetical protein [Deltaproteobacteria bacterium]
NKRNAFDLDRVTVTAAVVTNPNASMSSKAWNVTEAPGANLVLVKDYQPSTDRWGNPQSTPDDRTGLGIDHFEGDNRTNHTPEVGYDKQTGTSEALVFDLNGKIANEITLNLRVFYLDEGVNQEELVIVFYRNGEVVYSKDLYGDGLYNTQGAGQQLWDYNLSEAGGFDKVVIFPRNNGSTSTDQSDFFVKDIAFTYNEDLVHYTATGTFDTTGVGADGLDVHSLAFAAGLTLPPELDGYQIEQGNTNIRVVDAEGNLVFTVALNADGTWEFAQYGELPEGFDKGLDFAITGKDGDGDVFHSSISAGYQTADVIVHGGSHADSIHADDAGSVIYGGGGNDTIHGADGSDQLHGGDGDDLIYGGKGDDILFGDAGNDTIYGGEGNDVLYGGEGDDVLYGGDGADTFAWDNLTSAYDGDHDKIMDFNIGDGDRLMFKDILGDGEGQLNITASLGEDGNLMLNLEKGDITQTIEVAFDQGGIKWDGNSFDTVVDYVDSFTQNGASEQEALQNLMRIMTETGN